MEDKDLEGIVRPNKLSELEHLCDTMGWEWNIDNYGQIIIYTGLKTGPKGLEKWGDTDE